MVANLLKIQTVVSSRLFDGCVLVLIVCSAVAYSPETLPALPSAVQLAFASVVFVILLFLSAAGIYLCEQETPPAGAGNSFQPL